MKIFYYSMKNYYVPLDWKLANLTPIHKKGDKSEAENYQNWLTRRKQRLVINGKASEWVNITSGVLRGSVLEPLLFIIYINDLDCGLVSKLTTFADDIKLGSRADTHENVNNIQADLNRIVH